MISQKFAKLFIQEPAKSRTTCQIFISNSPEKEKCLGKLFGIIDLELPHSKENAKFVNSLATDIENVYQSYASVCNIKNIELKALDIETTFEKMLGEMNNKFIGLIQNKIAVLSIKKINIAIALLKNNYLYLSQRGRMNIFLIHKSEKNNYKIINIAESSASTDKKSGNSRVNSLNLFTDSINGKVNIGDSLLLCNDPILDYISTENIKKIIVNYPIEIAIANLGNSLLGLNNNKTFAAIIAEIKFQKDEIKLTSSSQKSIEKLVATEETTEKFLTPSLGLNTKKYAVLIVAGLKSLFSKTKKALSAYHYRLSREKIKDIIKPALSAFGGFGRKAPETAHHFGKNISSFIGDKEQRKNQLKNLSEKWQKIAKQLLEKFNQLPRMSRILLVVSFVLVILFLGSVISLNLKQKKSLALANFNQTVASIKNKINEAEASYLYHDEAKTRNLLGEAQNLANNLKKTKLSKDNQKTVADLAKNISDEYEKIRHMITISAPTVLSDLSSLNTELDVKNIISLGNKIYILNSKNNSLYQLNEQNKKIEQVSIGSIDIGYLQKGAEKDNNTILFYDDKQGFAQLNLSSEKKNLEKLEITFTSPNANIKDFTVYNQKLYLFDEQNNQIFRHQATSSGYGRGTPWIKDKNINLNGAISIAVDGSLYALKNNGQIIKFLSGRQQSFPTDSIDPALEAPTKIYTDADAKYIYILEPTNKRLVVIDKTGKLKAQYYSDSFQNLKDFIVNESKKEIYLLDGNKILEIVAAHL